MSGDLNQIVSQAKSEAKYERLKECFNKNRKLIKISAIAAGVALVLFVIFSFVQKSYQEKFSAMLHQSFLDQQIGDLEKAKSGLKQIHDSKLAPSGIKAIASLRYAAFLLQEGKLEESLAVYRDVNECAFCSPYLKDLAGLLTVRIWLSDDATIKDELGDKIAKIENNSKPLKNYISEQRAIYEMKKGNLEKSYKIFEVVAKSKDIAAPLKERAEMGMKMVVSKGYDPKAVIKEAGTSDAAKK